MWNIGKLKFKSRVVLAPMAGITSLSYREYLKPFGVAYSVTEMISDAGITHHNKKTIEYLKTSKKDTPVAIQLFGSKLETTLKAIDIINNELKIKYDILDLNFGCPVPKVTNAGAGSSWLSRPNELYKYVSAIVKYSDKPVTAKIRLGVDNEHINYKEIISLLTKAGVKAIGLHARTAKELYYGTPHYEMIKDLQKQMDVPLIISGNIFTLDDAINALSITKAKAVMVARGGLSNPYLIKQIDTYLSKRIKLDNLNQLNNIKYCRGLSKAIIKEKGEKTGISILRGIAPKFIMNIPKAKIYRCEISQNIKTYNDLDLILKKIEKEVKSYGRKESK